MQSNSKLCVLINNLESRERETHTHATTSTTYISDKQRVKPMNWFVQQIYNFTSTRHHFTSQIHKQLRTSSSLKPSHSP